MTISVRDPGSAITHFIGIVLAGAAAYPLLIKASVGRGPAAVLAMSIFMLSMVELYTASTLYHTVVVPWKVLKVFKRIDHMSIFVLIAGSYTPFCMLILPDDQGRRFLMIVWAMAAAGMIMKLCWVTCPKWVSSIVYIAMGWMCVPIMGPLRSGLDQAAFGWLLAGGIIYTIGGVVYALKLPLFDAKHKNFGIHEIFHLFVLGGSICHYVCMYLIIS